MTLSIIAALLLCLEQLPASRPAPSNAAPGTDRAASPVERLGPNLFRIGKIRVDTARREVSLQGHVNDVQGIEFLANSTGGMKAYESAITLDTDAINFNMALVLIGLDRANARPGRQHFDPSPVAGDPVALTVEFAGKGGVIRGPVERLLFDRSTKADIPPGEWVYTGSTFYPDGRFAAESDGVLIGFAHAPSSIIESHKGLGLGNYGAITISPGVAPGTALTLRITATGKPPARETK